MDQSEKNVPHPFGVLEKKAFTVRALLLAKRINTRSLEKSNVIALAPVLLRVGEEGLAAFFSYGVVVLFGVEPLEELRLREDIRYLLVDPFEEPEIEEIDVQVNPDSDWMFRENTFVVREIAPPHLQLIGDVLAKSVILSYYENIVARHVQTMEPVADRLHRRGGRGVAADELLRHMGSVLLNQQNMIGRVAIAEKPDILWEYPNLERFYARLEDEFEIAERHKAMERKLDLINTTAETMLQIVQVRHSHRLEWYIIILIVVEILLNLYELFLR